MNKREAYKAAQRMYANRMLGRAGLHYSTVDNETLQGFVDGLPLPISAAMDDHEWAWAEMRARFWKWQQTPTG